jgi:ADP-heptose:LPS heptosyltransferase
MTAAPGTVLAYSGLELMGDGFMKILFLRALRGAWPGARITWLAGKGRTVYAGPLRPLVAPYLDEVIEEAGIGLNASELFRRPLAGRPFDLVIDTQRRVLTTLVLRRARHRTFVSGAADFRLSDCRPARPYRKPAAMVEQLLDLVRAAAGREPELAPPPPLPAAYEAAARAALPEGKIHLGLVPGAGGRHKCWPRERYVALARETAARDWRPVFLLGPNEGDWLLELREAVPEARFPLQDPAVPAEIAPSPLFTVAVGRRLALAVTNDCGTAHMLAAAETPLVSLFGPSAPRKFAPSTPDLTIVRAQDFGGEAMVAIPLAAVLTAVARKLPAHPAGAAAAGAPR